jgi:hypothetical protein
VNFAKEFHFLHLHQHQNSKPKERKNQEKDFSNAFIKTTTATAKTSMIQFPNFTFHKY